MEGMEGGEGSQAAARHRGGEELIKPVTMLLLAAISPAPAPSPQCLAAVPSLPQHPAWGCASCAQWHQDSSLCTSLSTQSSVSWPPCFQPVLEGNDGAAWELGRGSEMCPALPKVGEDQWVCLGWLQFSSSPEFSPSGDL